MMLKAAPAERAASLLRTSHRPAAGPQPASRTTLRRAVHTALRPSQVAVAPPVQEVARSSGEPLAAADRCTVPSQRAHNPVGKWPYGHSNEEAESVNLTAPVVTPGVSLDFGKIFQQDSRLPSRTGKPTSPPAIPLPSVIQPKLAIGPVDDPLEHEADRVADQVMRMPDPEPSIGAAPTQISRMCDTCEKEHEEQKLQPKPAGTARPVGEAPPIVREVLHSPGEPLNAKTRAIFEQRFGHDFGAVRIHSDVTAGESATALNALAYTVGPHVAFAPRQYAPHSDHGRRLLAHELAHVIQQTGGAPRGGQPPAAAASTSRVSRALVQREASQVPPTGLDLHYPRCSDEQSRALQFEIEMARIHVSGAVAQLEDELARIESPKPGAEIITRVGSALDRYFKTREPALVKEILARLRLIRKVLDRGPNNWTCVTQTECAYEGYCGSKTAWACANLSGPVNLCGDFFSKSSGHVERSMVLVHEAAHQIGLEGDTYQYQKQFAGLGKFQAINNADSFSYFVQETALGGLPPAAKK
jgi:Domain of unknown function (DUF4157)/Lysine-specific metallo-endopeptidase